MSDSQIPIILTFRYADAPRADICFEPEDKGYGGRGYGCKDTEGFVWSFGNYNPLAQ